MKSFCNAECWFVWLIARYVTAPDCGQAPTAGVDNGTRTVQHRIAVLGASGYTGEEVVRLLALHPNFNVAALTGETQAGKVTVTSHNIFQEG